MAQITHEGLYVIKQRNQAKPQLEYWIKEKTEKKIEPFLLLP